MDGRGVVGVVMLIGFLSLMDGQHHPFHLSYVNNTYSEVAALLLYPRSRVGNKKKNAVATDTTMMLNHTSAVRLNEVISERFLKALR